MSWGTKTVASVALMLLAALIALIFEGADRVIQARIQRRLGPPLSQPFYDLVKLFAKESLLPPDALPWLFSGGPVFAAASALTIFLYIPIGSLPPVLAGGGDLLLALFLLFLSSSALILGALAGASPQGEVDAKKELDLIASCSVPLSVIASALAWFAYRQGLPGAPFSLETFVAKPVWSVAGWSGILGLIILAAAFLSLIPALADRVQRNIFGGSSWHFSGRILLLSRLARNFRTLAFCSIFVSLFFPGSMGRLLDLRELALFSVDFLFFWVKVFFVQTVAVTWGGAFLGRFKISRLSSFYGVAVTGVALAGLLLLFLDARL